MSLVLSDTLASPKSGKGERGGWRGGSVTCAFCALNGFHEAFRRGSLVHRLCASADRFEWRRGERESDSWNACMQHVNDGKRMWAGDG